MEIVIDHGHCRRRIRGDFNIIAKPGTLRYIIAQILLQIGDDPEHERFSFGTVEIRDNYRQFGPPNTPPKEWDE